MNHFTDEINGRAAQEFAKQNLHKIRTDVVMWTIEYQDQEGNTWIMDYPQGDLQGSGPPRLRRVVNSS
jgi:hypothetical protein